MTPSEGVVAIKGEFDGLDPLEFVSFNTIRMSFSLTSTTDEEGVGCAVEEEVEEMIEEGVDEPTLAAVVVDDGMNEESVERREEANGFKDVLMLLVKGVEGK